MNTITVDCGASFLKGALFQDNQLIKRAHRQSPVVHGNESLWEPVQLSNLLPLVKNLISELAEDIGDFTLCISNEMHGLILANLDGSPSVDYISWQKDYGSELIDGVSSVTILSQSEYANDVAHTGMPLRGSLPSSNLLYLMRKGMLPDTPLYYYTLGDYIIRWLSGREPICHPTNAAATGLYDVLNNRWNNHLIETVATENVVFPKVGNEAIEFDFNGHHVICYPALGDQQAALLGAGVETEGDLSFNLGTGAQVSMPTKEAILSNDYQLRPFFNGYYLRSIPHLPSGRALNVYIRFIKDTLRVMGDVKSEEEIWSALIAEEKKCTETNLQVDLSFFQTPLTDHQEGSISHISEYGLTIGSLMHAIFRQMVANFMWAAEKMAPNRSAIKRLVFSGGVARRIDAIREGVIANYDKNIPVLVASDETLVGLNKYATYGR